MSFNPQNRLEELLEKIARDPAYRPHFYRELCRAHVFVIFICQGTEDGLVTENTSAETRLTIPTLDVGGIGHVTFFSSVKRIQSFTDRPLSYGHNDGVKFLQMTRGNHLLLNPGSELGMTFAPLDVERLLDGSMWRPRLRFELPPGSVIALREYEPSNLLSEWMATLVRYFRTDRLTFPRKSGHPRWRGAPGCSHAETKPPLLHARPEG